MKRNSDKQTEFDKPIEKPFDELPDWFVRNLRSRLVTKKMTKNTDKARRRGIGRRYENVGIAQDRANS